MSDHTARELQETFGGYPESTCVATFVEPDKIMAVLSSATEVETFWWPEPVARKFTEDAKATRDPQRGHDLLMSFLDANTGHDVTPVANPTKVKTMRSRRQSDLSELAADPAPTPELNAILPGPEETEAPLEPVSAPVVFGSALVKRLRLIDRKLTEYNLRPDFVEDVRAILAGQRDEAEEP